MSEIEGRIKGLRRQRMALQERLNRYEYGIGRLSKVVPARNRLREHMRLIDERIARAERIQDEDE